MSVDTEIEQAELNLYYQYHKQQTPAMSAKEHGPESWRVNKTKYKSSDGNVKKIGEGWYCTISPKIVKSLDQAILEKIESAISKGIGAGLRQVGVIIMKGIIKVKITEEIRIYTDYVYNNKNGAHLIIFDKKGNHTVVDALSRTKLELLYIDLSGSTDDSSSGEDDHGGGVAVAAAAGPVLAAGEDGGAWGYD